MSVSPKKGLLAAALGLAVAAFGLQAGGVRAAQTVSLVPPPGADRAESGFAIHNGYAVQILENGGLPGAQVLFAPCTSTGTQYFCDPGAGTMVTLDGNGATNVNLNFNTYTRAFDAVVATNVADPNDQVIAVFNTTNIPTAYAVPGPLPYSAVSTTSTAPATTTQQNGGVVFVQPTVSLLTSAVCPLGFHGPVTVVLGNAGFSFGTFFGFGAGAPLGAQLATVICP